MRIRLTIAAVLAVFAISAPLASAESTGVPGAVEGVVVIEHITESGTNPVVLIAVSQNACQEHDRHGDASTSCGGEALAPPDGLIIGRPKDAGPPEGAGPPIGLDPGPPCRDGREAIICV